MLRRLLNILSAISMLLLLVTVLLWVRSHWVRDEITSQVSGVLTMLSSDAGRLHLCSYHTTPDNGYDHVWKWSAKQPPGVHVPLTGSYEAHEILGIGWDVRGTLPYSHRGIRYRQSSREWWIPHWLLALLAAPLSLALSIKTSIALLALVRRLREQRRQRRAGHCPTCNYDLRATPTRCPECGHSVPSSSPNLTVPS